MGKAKNLKARVASYFQNIKVFGVKTKKLITKIARIEHTIVESEIEALLLEAKIIKKHIPPYNVRWTDGKSYPFIRITVKQAYPAVLTARRTDDAKSTYFGPYPNISAMRLVLRSLRRIFPFHSTFNHPKAYCLYHHLGLCPCANVNGSEKEKREYRKNIYKITQFLDGKVAKVKKDLEKERNEYSKKEDFENSAKIQNALNAIELVTQPVTLPFEYEVNPNLVSDKREQELRSLVKILRSAGVPAQTLQRIECYDIANIQGSNPVGSLVVFTNGEKDSKWYRKFKIRIIKGPNDVLMMQHIIFRRLKHTEWPMPDLIIVDGGKAQVGAAAKAIGKSGKKILYVGLAKREEIIVTPDLKEVRLLKSEPALHLVQRIRNEAHRFATNYHKNLRSKTFLLG